MSRYYNVISMYKKVYYPVLRCVYYPRLKNNVLSCDLVGKRHALSCDLVGERHVLSCDLVGERHVQSSGIDVCTLYFLG